MAQLAQSAGVPCAIGSNLETDLGQAPNVCLAASLSAFPIDRFACDLMGAMFYKSSSVEPPIVFDRGRVTLPAGLGFGVTPRV
jgi:muconate cycloisomerase